MWCRRADARGRLAQVTELIKRTELTAADAEAANEVTKLTNLMELTVAYMETTTLPLLLPLLWSCQTRRRKRFGCRTLLLWSELVSEDWQR